MPKIFSINVGVQCVTVVFNKIKGIQQNLVSFDFSEDLNYYGKLIAFFKLFLATKLLLDTFLTVLKLLQIVSKTCCTYRYIRSQFLQNWPLNHINFHKFLFGLYKSMIYHDRGTGTNFVIRNSLLELEVFQLIAQANCNCMEMFNLKNDEEVTFVS